MTEFSTSGPDGSAAGGRCTAIHWRPDWRSETETDGREGDITSSAGSDISELELDLRRQLSKQPLVGPTLQHVAVARADPVELVHVRMARRPSRLLRRLSIGHNAQSKRPAPGYIVGKQDRRPRAARHRRVRFESDKSRAKERETLPGQVRYPQIPVEPIAQLVFPVPCLLGVDLDQIALVFGIKPIVLASFLEPMIHTGARNLLRGWMPVT